MRRLILVRHAKAEGAAASDRARALTARGRNDAAALGQWLAAAGLVPDLALVSAARRTEETWQLMAPALGEVSALTSEALYHAQAPQLRALITGTSDAVVTVAVIGHNPTVHELAAALSADDGRPGGLAGSFPTAAAAVIEFAAARWVEIGLGRGRLVAFVTPGQFKAASS